MHKKIASNDKILENIGTRMDSFVFAVKNQHSFNKIIESQVAQLAAVVPPSDQGKVPRQSKNLETTNLIDIHNTAFYYTQLSMKPGRQSTEGYAQGSDLSVDRCTSYELDGDARHNEVFIQVRPS
jgi:hypothetical protein